MLAAACAAQETVPASKPAAADLESNLALARERLDAGDLRGARRHADRAQALAPTDPRAAVWVGHVLFRMGEEARERSGPTGLLVRATFADAAASYEEALALGADAYETAFWASESHEKAGAPAKAVAAIERALAARPDDPAALVVRGRLLAAMGRLTEALAAFEKVLAAAPGSGAAADAATAAVDARIGLGDVDGAMAAFRAYAAGDPHGARDRLHKLVWERWRGTRNEPLWKKLLEEEAAAAPADPMLLYYLAELAVREGRDTAALALAERYLAQRPSDPDAHVFRAIAMRRTGRLDEARRELGHAYDLDRDRASTRSEFSQLVAAYYAAKRFREAVEVQEFVVHLTGAAPDRHDLAVLLLDGGRYPEAERSYRALAEDREISAAERARAWNALALLLQSQGRLDEAESAFKDAIAEAPDALDAPENLGILLIRRDRVDEGRKLLEQCRARDPLRKRSLYHLFRAAHPEVR